MIESQNTIIKSPNEQMNLYVKQLRYYEAILSSYDTHDDFEIRIEHIYKKYNIQYESINQINNELTEIIKGTDEILKINDRSTNHRAFVIKK